MQLVRLASPVRFVTVGTVLHVSTVMGPVRFRIAPVLLVSIVTLFVRWKIEYAKHARRNVRYVIHTRVVVLYVMSASTVMEHARSVIRFKTVRSAICVSTVIFVSPAWIINLAWTVTVASIVIPVRIATQLRSVSPVTVVRLA